MLSQAVYWVNRTDDPDGWFYKSRDEWQDETGLTHEQQETARARLKALGFWFERVDRIEHKVWFRIDDARLRECLTGVNRKTRFTQTVNHGSAKPGNTVPSNGAEITSETTSKAAPLVLTSEPVKNGDRRPKGDLFVDLLPQDWLGDFSFAESWRGFVDMRCQKFPLTDRAARLIIKDLRKWGIAGAKESLDASTRKNWRDVFEPKNGSAIQKPPPVTEERKAAYARFIAKHPVQKVRDVFPRWRTDGDSTWDMIKREFNRWSKTGKYDNEEVVK